jgi:hypothetical protein
LPPYLDVFADDYLDPVDVLMVINYLNGQTQGEGEQAPPVASTAEIWAPFRGAEPLGRPVTERSLAENDSNSGGRDIDLIQSSPLRDQNRLQADDLDAIWFAEGEATVHLDELTLDLVLDDVLASLADHLA